MTFLSSFITVRVVRVALGCAGGKSYTCFVLFKLSKHAKLVVSCTCTLLQDILFLLAARDILQDHICF